MERNVSKWRILPKMALTGVVKNGAVYYPYIGAGVFSVFTWFVFSSILLNDLIATLPNSGYAWMLLQVGRALLGIILLPFLFYTNGFLIKRRKKEIGLYSILGLEKKHIAIMMLLETGIIYTAVVLLGIISGTVLTRLLFLLLLRMIKLPADVEFVFYPAAFKNTVTFFAFIYGINFISNLIQVGKSRPTELMSGSRKGEREPGLLWVCALLGLSVLVWGYSVAIRSKIDGMIFLNFFLAVFLVIIGTYFLFTSGSVALLKLMKKKKEVYYRPGNFITISGMLYRMKKNAASLVNICIFSTMVIITFICTVSMYLGIDDIADFDYPYDINVRFQGHRPEPEAVQKAIASLEKRHGVKVEREDGYYLTNVSCGVEGNIFGTAFPPQFRRNNYKVNFLTLEDYNRIEKQDKELEEDEVLLLCTGENYGYDSLQFMGIELTVKEELLGMYAFPKAVNNTFGAEFYMIVKDKTVRDLCMREWADKNGVEDMEGFLVNESYVYNLTVTGEEESRKAFIGRFQEFCEAQAGFSAYHNNLDGRAMVASMNGGLLFIGILFGLIFFMCLILIMYYKQISEGYEDKEGFSIMQKVGMSDREIRGTIRRQILLVFFLPLAGAVLHTSAGMFMVSRLFATLRLFETSLITACALGVTAVFIIIYGASYVMTAKTYYRIVKQRER